MKWQKIGLVYANALSDHTHASVPSVLPLDDQTVRVYFSARDASGCSRPFVVDLALAPGAAPRVLTPVAPVADLPLGGPGTFDEHGIMPTWVLAHAGKVYLYYIGWNRGLSVPFRNALGLAVSDDGGATFRKVSRGPVLDRSIHDPCFVASACVRVEGARWRMWYLSAVEWVRREGKLEHKYHLKYAESDDGITWRRDGLVCIDFASPDEYAISRPSVVRDGDLYRMWYSHRGAAYRIGYAESRDGLRWERRDADVGIDVSPRGWDAQMIEYPAVFDLRHTRYMLYNGDNYGATGIGLAALEAP